MEPQEHKLIQKLSSAREKQKSRSLPIRALTVMAGATILLAGVVMLVAPGPAFAVIPIGLFILALEFVWAEQALGKALQQADKAKQAARTTTPAQKALLTAALLLAATGIALWALWGDIPLIPL